MNEPSPPETAALGLLAVDERFVDQLAAALAARLAGQPTGQPADGYLDADAAAGYLGVSRKRVHDLTSARALIPDGRDGRKPLYRRATLDAYARTGRQMPTRPSPKNTL